MPVPSLPPTPFPPVEVVGYPYWAEVIAQMLCQAGFQARHWRIEPARKPWLLRKIPALGILPYLLLPLTPRFWRARVIHHVGTLTSRALYPVYRLAHLLGKRVIVHWVGTDVLEFCRDVQAGRTDLLDFHRRVIQAHFAGCESLVEELAQAGLDGAQVFLTLPPGNRLPAEPIPLPAQPAVLTYWPHERRDFYGGPILDQLADAFPSVPFYVVGTDGHDEPRHPNMHYLGWVEDMRPVYERISVLVRLPRHDGMACGVVETLAHGRWAVFCNPMPHCEHARDFESARAALERCLNRTELNRAGHEFARTHFDFETECRRIAPLYARVLSGEKPESHSV